jgi:hypothetical protein
VQLAGGMPGGAQQSGRGGFATAPDLYRLPGNLDASSRGKPELADSLVADLTKAMKRANVSPHSPTAPLREGRCHRTIMTGCPQGRSFPGSGAKENRRLLDELRGRLSVEQASLLLFLGAGLSYGVSTGRGTFEDPSDEIGARFPGWHLLIRRMFERLRGLSDLEPYQRELETFFKEEGPLDCAELFRDRVGAPDYVEFLRQQFGSLSGSQTPKC